MGEIRMEKYKTIILIEKIRKYLEEGNRKEALAVAESIDKKKLKNMMDLSIVAESYFQNGNYEEARVLYQRIYQKTKSRRIVAQLVHLSIKLNDIEAANQYLDEFIQIAPQDFYQHIFRFSIDKLMKAPLAKLIEDLVELKNMEYIESWAYELAKLYHKAGIKDACIAECDDIILWFGNGEYVDRAKALRAYYKGELNFGENDPRQDVKVNSGETLENSKSTDFSGVEKEEVDQEIEEDRSEEDRSEEDRSEEVRIEEDKIEVGTEEVRTEEDKFKEDEIDKNILEEDRLKRKKKESKRREKKRKKDSKVDSKNDLEEIEKDIEGSESCLVAKTLASRLSEQSPNQTLEQVSKDDTSQLQEQRIVKETLNEDISEEEFENLENALAKQVLSTFLDEEKSHIKTEDANINKAQSNDTLDVKLGDGRVEDETLKEVETIEQTDAKVEKKEMFEQVETKAQEIEAMEQAESKAQEIEAMEQAETKAQEIEAIEQAETKVEVMDTLKNPDSKVAVTKELIEDQVEAELYRLLEEESKELVKTEDIQLVTKDEVEEAKEQVLEKTLGPKTKVVQKKINLKILSNEQLVGDDQDDLMQELIRNQISLLDIFANFMRMDAVRKQLVRSIDQILTQRSKNVIITGETQSGKTRLAKCIAKLLYRMKLIQTNKVALVDGEKLNSKSLMSKKEQLKDCVVIIEHSGMMSKETVKTLLDLSAMYHNNIAIVLEDTREKINRLLRSNSQLNSIFNNRIHLHKYTMEDYMGFAYDYITEHDYEIEMDAFIALQNEFAVFMNKKRDNALKAILSYLDSVIIKSEKRSSEQLKVIAQTGHYAETELMVLKKEDIKS